MCIRDSNFTVLENIILGVETTSRGFLKMDKAREKVTALSERYGLPVSYTHLDVYKRQIPMRWL